MEKLKQYKYIILIVLIILGLVFYWFGFNLSSNHSDYQSFDCDIKGNINSKSEKIYHLPNCKSYSLTKIDESSGERMFCSEREAITAGWRKAENCPN